MRRNLLALLTSAAAIAVLAAAPDRNQPDPVQAALAFARAHDLIAANPVLNATWHERDKLWRVSVDFPIFASDPEGGDYFSLVSACVARDGRVWEGILPSRAWFASVDDSARVVTTSTLACEVARAHLTGRGFISPPPIVRSAPLNRATMVTIVQCFADSTADVYLFEVESSGEVRKLRTESLVRLKRE